MGIHVIWAQMDPRLLLIQFNAGWTNADFIAMLSTVRRELQNHPEPSTILVDLTDSGARIPAHVLTALRKTGKPILHRQHRLYVVGASPTQRGIIDITRRLPIYAIPADLHFFETRDEAMHALDWLTWPDHVPR